MPRPRLIDDTKMIGLYKQGKSLKDIGKELNVSSVAIHKRIKKLNLKHLPESLEKLTHKEKSFVLAVAEGQSRTSAVMQTFDVSSRESAKALQTTLMKDPEIRLAIDDLMEMKGIGREYRIEKLKQHLEHPDPVVSLKSLDMAMKIADDSGERRKDIPEKVSFIKVDLTAYRNPDSFSRRQGECAICETSTNDDFCPACFGKYPVLTDKIIRHWNGDKCASCNDDRRCFDFCKACNE